MNVQDKVVLITGAARGIGKALAEAFGAKGAKLALADIDDVALKTTTGELERAGSVVKALTVDVTSEEQVTSMVETTIKELGGLDVLVNNAGVFVAGPADSTPVDDWKWAFDVNVWPHIYAVRAALPYFKKQGSGHLVHVASAAGILGTPALAAYCATKFAVYGLAESLAVSLHGSGIGVSAVCPLWVNTDITDAGRLSVEEGLSVGESELKKLGREFLETQGLPAGDVASATVAAVQTGQFLVLPNPEVLKFAQAKWSDPERYIKRAAETLASTKELFGEKV